MSIIKTFYNKTLPVASKLAPAAQVELDRLMDALDDLNRQHPSRSFAVAAGEPDAVEAMVTWRQQLVEAQVAVVDAKGVLEVALQRDQEVERNKRAQAFAGQLASVKAHVTARDKAALRLQATIENLANDYAEILKVNQKIEASLAAQGFETFNALTAQGTLFSAVADELFRRGHGEQASNGTFPNHVPGAKPTDFRSTPDAMVPLHERVKAAGQWIVAQFQPSTAPPTAPAAPTRSAAAQVIGPPEPFPVTNDAASSDAEVFARLVQKQGTTDGNQIALPVRKLSA